MRFWRGSADFFGLLTSEYVLSFDAPPTRSRLTAPPKKLRKLVFPLLILSYGWFVGNGLDRSGRFAAIAKRPGGVGSPRPTGQ